METVKVRLVRSIIGCNPTQRRTVKALGLSRIRQVRELPKNESVLGMVRRVEHLVEVVE